MRTGQPAVGCTFARSARVRLLFLSPCPFVEIVRHNGEDERNARSMTQIAREDLPIWMQNSLRGTDWGVLIVLVFSLLAAWPFLLQPGLPRTNASEHYVYRAADTAQAFAEGLLYPRWSPNALTGHGAPI